MTDEFSDQIGKLHQHIEHVSRQVKDVKAGQDDLHKEHMQLRERVDVLERNVIRDIDNLAAHEREADIYRGHLLDTLAQLTESNKRFHARLDEHALEDERDRKEVIKGQRNTIRSIILAAVTFFATGAVLLWNTGVLA